MSDVNGLEEWEIAATVREGAFIGQLLGTADAARYLRARGISLALALELLTVPHRRHSAAHAAMAARHAVEAPLDISDLM